MEGFLAYSEYGQSTLRELRKSLMIALNERPRKRNFGWFKIYGSSPREDHASSLIVNRNGRILDFFETPSRCLCFGVWFRYSDEIERLTNDQD